jgi:hypothetical protein
VRVTLAGQRGAGQRCACVRGACHRWSVVVWLRGSPAPFLSHHPAAVLPLGLAGAVALQMAAMVVTRSPPGGPSWLGVEPLCLAISGSGRCFRLY